jgi:hypothetical protein
MQVKLPCSWFLYVLRQTSQILNTTINVTDAITLAEIVSLTVS